MRSTGRVRVYNTAMKVIKYFKAKVDTKKFKKNQKVWVTIECGNHLHITSKWRGKGRWVSGIMAKFDSSYENLSRIIGNGGIKEMEVTDDFYNRVINY